MSKSKRIIALFVAAAIALSLCFSVIFIAQQSEHTCSGAFCEICQQVSAGLKIFEGKASVRQSGLAVALTAFLTSVSVHLCVFNVFVTGTPITLKVKLTD